jgi:hypothetical protein
MKKILTVLMMLALVMCMSVSVFAGGFVSSPSINLAPELVEFKNKDKNCTAEIVTVSFAERDTLPESERIPLNAAYASIVDNTDIGTLNADIAKIAEDLGVTTKDLVVSDLFDMYSTGCKNHEEHGKFEITLKADTLKNFVCLLHYTDSDSKWTVVKDAEVTKDGMHLEFTEGEFSPFAIVVSSKNLEPKSNTAVVATVATVSTLAVAGGGVGFYFVWKKRKTNV